MNIVLLTPYWLATKGGISTYVYHLAEELKRETENNVTVVTRDDGEGAIKVSGNKVVCLIKLPSVFRKLTPDVIHCHNLEVLLLGALLYRLLFNSKVKILFTFHTQPPPPTPEDNKSHKEKAWWKKSLFAFALTKCNRLTFVSKKLGEEIIEQANLSVVNFAVTPPGVRKKEISEKEISAFKKKFDLKNAGPTICMISVLNWEMKVKGVEILIKAFKEIVKNHAEAKLLIIGDGQFKDNLLLLSKQLNLDSNIIFCGYMDNSTLALTSSDIYCHISLQEGLPHAILEAMVVAKPVIASNVGGIPEIVFNRENGLLVEPEVDSIIDAFDYLIRYPEKKARLGKNAEIFVNRKFLWPHLAKGIMKLYRDC